MEGVKVKVISTNDPTLYARSANTRIISNEDILKDQSATPKTIQISSGRRKAFEAKNDPEVEKRSERRISARMPRFEDGELRTNSLKLEAVKTDTEIARPSSPPIAQSPGLSPPEQTPLSPKLQSLVGAKLIPFNVSPPLGRKEDDAITESHTYLIGSELRTKIEKVDKVVKATSGELPVIIKSDSRSPVAPLSPVAERRSDPKTGKKKVRRKKSTRDPAIQKSANVHYDSHSTISPAINSDISPEQNGSDRHSNRRHDSSASKTATSVDKSRKSTKKSGTLVDDIVIKKPSATTKDPPKKERKPKETARPKSPHRLSDNTPRLRVGGRQLTSRDMENLDKSTDSSAVSTQASSEVDSSGQRDSSASTSTSDVTSRRKIKTRKEAINRKIEEKYEGKFYPEDDQHLKSAIKIALEESRQASVKEALEAGHDLNAKILESLHRPNALEEVIEKMVSNRREALHEKKISSNRRPVAQPVKKNPPPKKSNANKSSQRRSDEEIDKLLTRKIKPTPSHIDNDYAEDGDDEEPLIETIEDPDIVVKGVPINSKPASAPRQERTKAKVSVNPLPGQPILVATEIEETEPLKVPSLRRDRLPEADVEKNVKLPRENRKIRKGDVLDKADDLGQRDFVYDPLGADQPFGDEEDSVGDDMFEESSEDETKLTINEKKDEMLYRFKLVKEAYPGVALPRITKKMKLAKMVRHYEHIMSRIKLKVKTRNFKIFLIGGFLLMQFLGKKVFGMDTSGFTVNQMYSLKRYEHILREFGESDWSSIGSDLPAMVRLPIFMVVNMGIFIVAKWIFKKTGKDYTAQFHKLYAQLTGGDDYAYIKDDVGDAGMDAGGGEEGGESGGVFGILKSVLGMMGGGGGGGLGAMFGGGGGDEERPKRGEAKGPTYKRKSKKPDA